MTPADATSSGNTPDARLSRLEASLRGLGEDVRVLDQMVRDFAEPTIEPDEPVSSDKDEFVSFYSGVEEWVTYYFAPMFYREISGNTWRWCAHWWAHAEAITRLEAMWRTWEVARLEPVRGMASWLRDVLDPQMSILLSISGPFAACAKDRHETPEALPVKPAPRDYWESSPAADDPVDVPDYVDALT